MAVDVTITFRDGKSSTRVVETCVPPQPNFRYWSLWLLPDDKGKIRLHYLPEDIIQEIEIYGNYVDAEEVNNNSPIP